MLGTFGRGFYVLDDYSALREIGSPDALSPGHAASLYPLRDAYIHNQVGLAPPGTAGIGAMSGNWIAPNPPYGAVFTYSVTADLPAEEKLVLTISDETGRPIRRLDLEKSAGLRRIAWNLRGEAPTTPAGGLPGFGGGRGGNLAPLVAPGRYRATIGRLAADKVTPVGEPRSFSVLPIELK